MSSTATTSCSSSGVWNIARAGSWDFFSWKYDSTRSLLCKLLSNRIKRICEGNRKENMRKTEAETENRSPNSDHMKINSDIFIKILRKPSILCWDNAFLGHNLAAPCSTFVCILSSPDLHYQTKCLLSPSLKIYLHNNRKAVYIFILLIDKETKCLLTANVKEAESFTCMLFG